MICPICSEEIRGKQETFDGKTFYDAECFKMMVIDRRDRHATMG